MCLEPLKSDDRQAEIVSSVETSVDKLTSQLALDLCRTSKTAHALYAAEPSGHHGAVVKRVQSHLVHAMEELRTIGWGG